MSRNKWLILASAIIVIAVLLGHVLELAQLRDCNPMFVMSGLARSGLHDPADGMCFLDGNAGETTQALGHLVAEQWLSGQLPWWDHFAGIGLPLAAEMQPAAFFLPFVLLLKFQNGLLVLRIILQIMAGFATLAVARRVGLTRAASVFAGTAFALSSMFAWIADAPMLPLAFLPILLLGIEIARGHAAGAPVVAMAIAYSIVAGFPEVAFMDGVLAFLWALVRMRSLPLHTRLSYVARIAIGGIVGILLSAPASIVFLDGLTRASLLFHAIAKLPNSLASLPQLFFPNMLGPLNSFDDGIWVTTPYGYLGVALLAAAMAGLGAAGPKRVLAWTLGIWSVFWLTFSYAAPAWILNLPLLRQIVFTRYPMQSVVFAVVMLAGFGLDGWFRGDRRWRLAALAPLAALLSFAVYAIAPAAWTTALLRAHFAVSAIMVGLSLATATVVLFHGAPTLPRRAMMAGVLMAEVGGLFIVATLPGAPFTTLDTSPVAFLRHHQNFGRTMADGILNVNYGSTFGVATLSAEMLPVPALWTTYASAIDPRLISSWWSRTTPIHVEVAQNTKPYRALGVRYLAVRRDADRLFGHVPPGLHVVFESAVSRIYELDDPAPYFEAGASCRLSPKDRDTLETDCAAATPLLRRELFDPGWRARDEAGKLGVVRVGDVFQQIMLRPGHHRVHFRYAPPYSNLMGALFGTGVLGLLWLIWQSLRERGARRSRRLPTEIG